MKNICQRFKLQITGMQAGAVVGAAASEQEDSWFNSPVSTTLVSNNS